MSSLLNNRSLEQSPIVANSLMNRERACTGGNSYQRELFFSPLDFLRSRLPSQAGIAWLDLCCGEGRALVEAARVLSVEKPGGEIHLVGVDLVPMFRPCEGELSFLRLVAASVTDWQPDRSFDLITCVHGLHYVGDKLGLIRRAASWLREDALLLAHLDPNNLRLSTGQPAGRRILTQLRGQGLEYHARRHLLRCQGPRRLSLPYHFVGANDDAGPNYTGQAAVDSHYRVDERPRLPRRRA